jgi:hypothetical protein
MMTKLVDIISMNLGSFSEEGRCDFASKSRRLRHVLLVSGSGMKASRSYSAGVVAKPANRASSIRRHSSEGFRFSSLPL